MRSQLIVIAAVLGATVLATKAATAEKSNLVYGTITDSSLGHSDLAIEAWSYEHAGAGITVYQIPSAPTVGVSCAIETQYALDDNDTSTAAATAATLGLRVVGHDEDAAG